MPPYRSQFMKVIECQKNGPVKRTININNDIKINSKDRELTLKFEIHKNMRNEMTQLIYLQRNTKTSRLWDGTK